MQKIETFINVVEAMNRKIGKASSYLIFVFMGLMVYEVIARYFFDSPTIWVHEVCGFLFAGYVALTGAWVLLEKGHVAVDIIYQYFPDRAKDLADMVVSIIALFMFTVLFWQGYKFAWHAFVTGQHSHTLFAPLLWPVKTMLPLGALFFLFQILADLARSIIQFKQRSPR
jgi:TRAP-type mannitol/chloroaromatic compound transport system permease small subunit